MCTYLFDFFVVPLQKLNATIDLKRFILFSEEKPAPFKFGSLKLQDTEKMQPDTHLKIKRRLYCVCGTVCVCVRRGH